MAGKFRHELKYYINTATYYVLRHRLSALLSLDENAREENRRLPHPFPVF